MPFHAIIEVWGHFHHKHELGFLYSTYYTKLEVPCHFYHSIKRQSLDINQLLSLMTISIIKIFYQLMEKSSKLLTKVPTKKRHFLSTQLWAWFLLLYMYDWVLQSPFCHLFLMVVSWQCYIAIDHILSSQYVIYVLSLNVLLEHI